MHIDVAIALTLYLRGWWTERQLAEYLRTYQKGSE